MNEGAYYSTIEDDRAVSAEELDTERRKNQAYEYLCRLQEAREWLSKEIGEVIDSGNFEESLRDGVYLGKLVKKFAPELIPKIFVDSVLQYRHTDNINSFFQFAKKIGLPYVFMFELVDLYEKKNPPRVIYCIHALAHYLSKKKVTGDLEDVFGRAKFSEEEIAKKAEEINAAGLSFPNFVTISTKIERTKMPENDIITEKALFLSDKEERFKEDIESVLEGRLDSDVFVSCREDVFSPEDDPVLIRAASIVQGYVRMLLQRKSIDEIQNRAPMTLFTLRSFLPLLSGEEEMEEMVIEELNKILTALFSENAAREKSLSNLENRISLLIKNKIGNKDEALKEKGTYMQFKSLQKLFAWVHDDPSLFVKAIAAMREEDAEIFIKKHLLTLFGNAKTPKEEYNYLRVAEALVKESKTFGTKHAEKYRYISLASSAIQVLIVTHCQTYPQKRIQQALLNVLKKEQEGGGLHAAPLGSQSLHAPSSLVSRALVESLPELPYPIQFFSNALLTVLNEEHPENTADNIFTLLSTVWEVFFAPFITEMDALDDKIPQEASEEAVFLSSVCEYVSRCIREKRDEWRRAAEKLKEAISLLSISEYYTLQYIENRPMSNLLCLSGDEVNYLLDLLKNTPDLPQDLYALVQRCSPFPFKLVFVVPGGISHSPEESTGAVEKKMAKWAVVKLLKCTTGKNMTDLLQRISTKEEEERFLTNWEMEAEKYKDETKSLLTKLFDLGLIRNINTCDELLRMIAQDIVFRGKHKIARAREIKATEKAIVNLEEARRDIETRQRLCSEYLALLSLKIIKTSKMYTSSAKKLLEDRTISRMFNWAPSQVDSVSVCFKSEESGKICISVLILGLSSASEFVTLDELLLRESRSDTEIRFEGVGCVFSIPKLIHLINRKFLR